MYFVEEKERRKSMKDYMKNDYLRTGTDVNEFNKVLDELSAATTTMVVGAKEIALLSRKDSDDPKNVWFYHLVPDAIWNYNSAGVPYLSVRKIDREALVKIGAEDLLNEYEKQTSLMMMINGCLYFTSDSLPATLGMRANVAGDQMYIPSVERDILVAKGLNKDEATTCIIRNDGGLRKVVSVLTSKYTYQPQTLLTDIYNQIVKDNVLGKVSCRRWNVDQHTAEIYLEFPEKADELADLYELEDKITPGVYLAKSDTGDCSITVRATWRIGNSTTIQSEYKRKHIGVVKKEDILKSVKESVFDKYTILPDMLCELMAIDITDPSWRTSMLKKDFECKHKATVAEAFKNIFKQLEMVKAIGKKNEKALYEELCSEINPELDYTAYDIAVRIMTIPESVRGLPKAYEPKLAMACGKAPYADYTTKTKASSVYLTA
jgi:hypothetical protein